MEYPLRYGYSLVGRVAKCGAGVDPDKFAGKLVFTFSPHSSWVVADADAVMLVPEVLYWLVLYCKRFILCARGGGAAWCCYFVLFVLLVGRCFGLAVLSCVCVCLSVCLV